MDLNMADRVGIRRAARAMMFALMLGVSTLSGCSPASNRPKLLPVSGTVKFKGAPLANATVTFLPEGSAPRNPYGTTDKDGNFQLTSYDTNDGAVAGDYVVTIVAKPADGKKPEERTASDMIALGPGGSLKAEDTVPTKYADKKTSDLKRSVVAGDKNVFNFDLKE